MQCVRSLAVTAVVVLSALASLPAHAASRDAESGTGRTVVTFLPQKGVEPPPVLPAADLQLKVSGKDASITAWTPLTGPGHRLEVVLLIDGGAQTSLATQFSAIQGFIQHLPADAAVAVAYMANGRALLVGPMTTDHAAALRGVHFPLGGPAGISASPYFCLSDLAKNWPSQDPEARREAVLITDGIDNYAPNYDPADPYVLSAIEDALRHNLVVYSIYWGSRGRFDASDMAAAAGQSLLNQVAIATGGTSYGIGMGNPVSLEPYFADIQLRVDHQYGLTYQADPKVGSGVQNLKLQVRHPAGKLTTPLQSYVERKPSSK